MGRRKGVPRMEENRAPMALGSIWKPEYAGQMSELLEEADSKMYEDKRRRRQEEEAGFLGREIK